MAQSANAAAHSISQTHRHPSGPVQIQTLRPSVLGPFLSSEPAFGPCVCKPNVVVLYLMNIPVAIIQATAIDQAALDGWLTRIRSRGARPRGTAAQIGVPEADTDM